MKKRVKNGSRRMTLDTLGRMVQHGFSEQTREVTSLKFELKADIEIVRAETKAGMGELRQEISELHDSVRQLSVSVEKLAGVIEDLRQEYAAIKTQLDRHEKWIKQIAKKAGVTLNSES